MSIDLDWDTLFQSSLASRLVEVINKHLASTVRPSFIGPVTVTSLDFGSASPDVEVVDIRDIYRDFLEDDEDELGTSQNVKTNTSTDHDDVDGFEWVSRKAAGKGTAEDLPSYHHLPPHIRYGKGPSTDPFCNSPVSPRDIWQGTMSVPNLTSIPTSPPLFRSMLGTSNTTFAPPSSASNTPPLASEEEPSPSLPASATPSADAQPQKDELPSLQLHLRITHQSNLRLTLTTSLLINYPSPSFMSLPIKLSIIGLIFTGEVVVAYEGARRRVHLCILDDLDPYGPAGDRSNRDSSNSDSSESGLHPGKPLPVGLRLLPSIFIESEIGQADKHVLKNVTRVERFIQDVIRKTVEEELLFPNYHTLVLENS